MSDRARKLHASKWSGVLHVTGGGSGFLSEMLKEPGASKTILEASIPYSEKSLSELLGGPAEQACSPSTARALAMAAFEKAKSYGVVGNFGLGCTASLATNREKKANTERTGRSKQTMTHSPIQLPTLRTGKQRRNN